MAPVGIFKGGNFPKTSPYYWNIPLRFEWEYPDPAELELELIGIRDRLYDATALMEEAKGIAIADMKWKFETETDTRGQPWQPWAKSYEAVAEAENVGILRKTEYLYDRATDPRNYDVSPTSLRFNTDRLPEYWAFHDQPGGGTQRIPARTFTELTPRAITKIGAAFTASFEGGIKLKGKKVSHVSRSPVGEFAVLPKVIT